MSCHPDQQSRCRLASVAEVEVALLVHLHRARSRSRPLPLTALGARGYVTLMNRSSQPHPLRVGYRSAAAFVALLWCVAPALSALHATLQIHRYCAEHGVLEEVEASGGETGGVEASGGEIGGVETSGPLAGGGDDETVAHEDCAFVGFFRQGRLLDAPGSAPVGLDPAALNLPQAGEQVPAPVELLRLAPKTSPPA
jgi:hypothetical protein